MMNELDNYKNAWKTIAETELKKEYSVDDLKKIVKKRSNSELSKIRRKLIFEWALSLVLSVFLVAYMNFVNPSETRFAIAFVIVVFVVSFAPYMRILKFQLSQNSDLRTYLKGFLDAFNTMINQYVKLSVFLIPIASIGAFILGAQIGFDMESWAELFAAVNFIWLILSLFFIGVASYWIPRKYFKLIYGKNIKRLENCLSDLEEAENGN